MAMPLDKAMYMVERNVWEARPPRYRFKTRRPTKVILLRYTKSQPCTEFEECCKVLLDVQRSHMEDKGWADIMYSFMIGGDGRVYEGTGWRHTTNKEMEFAMHEFVNIDIAYIGQNKDDVTPDMRWAARKLLEHSMSLEYVDPKSTYFGDKEAIDLLFT